jgi:putative pyruvate formate lyase activating enzyme
MDQYRPCFKAADLPGLNRPITRNEYREAIRLAEVAGLHRLEIRGARWTWIATE